MSHLVNTLYLFDDTDRFGVKVQHLGKEINDKAFFLTFYVEGKKVFELVDSRDGKELLKVADAIMTALTKADKLHEAEQFNTVSLA